ncbi:MAG: hypothetical protein GX564_13195 [Oligosphaeraceae bacterium]|nr:hypothetical protein [Oligosphaeraceae bacterium]
MLLPTVDFCGLRLTRLLLGANPFGGFSHQTGARDEAMRSYHTPERILETWERAWQAGINTFVTNNETRHVIETTEKYLSGGGPMQWIAQVSFRTYDSMEQAIDRAVAIGCRALYFHGGLVDELFAQRDEASIRRWVEYGQRQRIPVGVAAHNPQAHEWVNALRIVDFHAVPFFNCGSVHHHGGGEKFQLEDVFQAMALIRALPRPCIAYKILGAGRIDPVMGFDYALRNIKAGDVINVGMNRLDNDRMVEENAALAARLLGAEKAPATRP